MCVWLGCRGVPEKCGPGSNAACGASVTPRLVAFDFILHNVFINLF